MRTDCHDIQQSLGLLPAGELSDDESKRIETHLAACADCRSAQARFARLDALLAAAPSPELSRDEIQLMALRARASSQRSNTIGSIVALAAVLLMVLIPIGTYLTVEAPQRPVSRGTIEGFSGTFELDF